MVKTKIGIFSVLLMGLVSCHNAGNDFRFEWTRTDMDGSRTKAGINYCAPAKKVQAIVEAAQPEMAFLKEVIGYSPEAMTKYSPQSPLGNWYADAMLDVTEMLTGTRCDLSVNNLGGVRVDMPQGDVTVEDLLSMFPFKNYVCILEIKGSKLMELFTWMAKTRWQILGGVKIVCNGSRIESVMIGGQPLDKNKIYRVETNSFLLKGGDDMFLEDLAISCEILPEDNYAALLKYLRKSSAEGKQIVGAIDDRIIDKAAKNITPKTHPTTSNHIAANLSDQKPCLVILHTNDTHSHIEPIRSGEYTGMCGVVERAVYIDSVRTVMGKNNVLLVDAGDWDQGSPYFTIFKGYIEIDCMNAMGYDVACPGNHEWDNGAAAFRDRLKTASFKTVMCNCDCSVKGMDKLIKPYTIINRGGLRIGVIGVITDVTSVVDAENRGVLTYKSPAPSINEWSSYLKNRKACDLVIVLSHCGYEGKPGNPGDIEFVKDLHDVDIIIGGHTHTDLRKEIYLPDADQHQVLIVTNHCWGLHMGEIRVFNNNN